MKAYKVDIFKEKTVEVLDDLFAENLITQQVLVKIIKNCNIDDPYIQTLLNILKERIEKLDNNISELKKSYKELVL